MQGLRAFVCVLPLALGVDIAGYDENMLRKYDEETLPAKVGGYSRLHDAAIHNDVAKIKALLEGGASVDMQAHDKRTPLHMAAQFGKMWATEALLTAGASVEARAKNTWTPLHFAAYFGHEEVVEALIKVGASIEAQDANERTPLDLAMQEGDTDSVQILLAEQHRSARSNKNEL